MSLTESLSLRLWGS